ncbi:MAG: hypothetical protein ACKVTZ_02740 [Bacteroidia bacterium]
MHNLEMNMDTEKEWLFIQNETIRNKPKSSPYRENDRVSRELLFLMQTFLAANCFMEYQQAKQKYLDLVA